MQRSLSYLVEKMLGWRRRQNGRRQKWLADWSTLQSASHFFNF